MSSIQKLAKQRLKFNLFLLSKLPLAWLAGVRVVELNNEQCKVSVPYKWLSQNPFRSTYFAALSMAAEMSTGLLVLNYTADQPKSISTLVRNLEAEFVKKAVNKTTFTCKSGKEINEAVKHAIASGDGQEVQIESVGKSETGEEVARFKLTWGIKVKSSQKNK